jgi:hypothetical protein
MGGARPRRGGAGGGRGGHACFGWSLNKNKTSCALFRLWNRKTVKDFQIHLVCTQQPNREMWSEKRKYHPLSYPPTVFISKDTVEQVIDGASVFAIQNFDKKADRYFFDWCNMVRLLIEIPIFSCFWYFLLEICSLRVSSNFCLAREILLTSKSFLVLREKYCLFCYA